MVTKIEPAGKARPAARMPEILVQPVKIVVDVENVLRGQVKPGLLDVYVFVYAADNRFSFGKREFVLMKARYIWFLMSEGGVLRSVGDVTELYFRGVPSGSHRNVTFPPGASLGEKISRILLSPGEGVKSEWFAKYIALEIQGAEKLTSPEFADSLVRDLLRDEHPDIRKSACELLAVRQYWRDLGSPAWKQAQDKRDREILTGCPSYR
jgi:hypothetical protein